MSPDWTNALVRARKHSPFLSGQLDRWGDLAALLADGEGEAALSLARAAGEDSDSAEMALRRRRMATALVLGVGDLAGAFTLDRVMGELSDLADHALDAAIAAAIRQRVPDAEIAGFTGLALGKHGARELNYSSDIDPILLYDRNTLPRRDRDDPAEAAQRYAREIVRLLSQVTAEGYVFRVDLRLRPAAEITPLAVSFGGALSHYESSALAWERAAHIRTRTVAGDIAAGEDFTAQIEPFVWRRSLDFGAIEEVRRLTERIRASHSGPREVGPDYNVKLGRGGIREIEFFAQTHQLIHGGRDPSLRVRGTVEALQLLAKGGYIEDADADALSRSYEALRTVEHRLQMVGDRQTHTLPSGDALANVAHLAGYDGAEALLNHVRAVVEPVAERFDALIDEPDAAPAHAASALPHDSGQADLIATIHERMQRWKSGRLNALRSEAARAAFEDVESQWVAALLSAPDPDHALVRVERFLERLPSAINLFRLLEARPGLFDRLLRILTLSPPLADRLARRPELLDTLIDRSAFDLPGSVDTLQARMAKARRDDYEARLDQIRTVTGEARFTLGVQLIEAVHDPLDIAAALSRTAEAGVRAAHAETLAVYRDVHGTVPDSELVVLALGRFGGEQLTHSSDLDLIYLFTGTFEAESDGPRPLGATLYYNRLAQRVTAALTVPTAEGALYEVDTRLRPQGAQGPLAASVDSFLRYQRDDAWTFEHMALARSRVVAGSDAAKTHLTKAIAAILSRPRDDTQLRDDVLSMRLEMARSKSPAGPLDVKLLRGGLVDAEFAIHYLQLKHGTAVTPHLPDAIAQLTGAGLLPEGVEEAAAFLTRVLVVVRLLAPAGAVVNDQAAERLAAAVGEPDLAGVLRRIDQCRHTVADAWRATFGHRLEIEQ